jgi:O-methyltransferase
MDFRSLEDTLKERTMPARVIRKLLRAPYNLARMCTLPWWTAVALLDPEVGAEYGIKFGAKMRLLRLMRRNASQPGSASTFFEHVYIVKQLFEVPKSTPGAVAEFGCFKGFSSSSLSLACAMTNRELLVFDSFEGLPEPDVAVHNLDSGAAVPYHKGQYKGALDDVKANITRFGDISVCEFIQGYFENTLPKRPDDEKFVLIFEDADLVQSVRSVLCGAWKKLQPGCVFFCHEARDREVVDIFFDKKWWADSIGESAPGFIGSGVGMMSGPTLDWCCLGFTKKAAN